MKWKNIFWKKISETICITIQWNFVKILNWKYLMFAKDSPLMKRSNGNLGFGFLVPVKGFRKYFCNYNQYRAIKNCYVSIQRHLSAIIDISSQELWRIPLESYSNSNLFCLSMNWCSKSGIGLFLVHKSFLLLWRFYIWYFKLKVSGYFVNVITWDEFLYNEEHFSIRNLITPNDTNID